MSTEIAFVINDTYGGFNVSEELMQHIADHNPSILHPPSPLAEEKEMIPTYRAGHYSRQFAPGLFLHDRYNSEYAHKTEGEAQVIDFRAHRLEFETRSCEALVDAVRDLGTEKASGQASELKVVYRQLNLTAQVRDGKESNLQIALIPASL